MISDYIPTCLPLICLQVRFVCASSIKGEGRFQGLMIRENVLTSASVLMIMVLNAKIIFYYFIIARIVAWSSVGRVG
jgi:hypothetical protein